MEQCKRILKPQGDSMWSHLGRSRKCSETRPANASVGAATTPGARWRRYNPTSKLRWRQPVKAPVHSVMQNVKAAAAPGTKLRLVNPLYYIRRIKNKLARSKRQRTPS